MRISRFEWDGNNINHIARHGVTPGEVEDVFFNAPLYHKAREGLKIALGRTDNGRYLFVVFALKPGGTIRVITARDMSTSEKRYYRRQKGE